MSGRGKTGGSALEQLAKTRLSRAGPSSQWVRQVAAQRQLCRACGRRRTRPRPPCRAIRPLKILSWQETRTHAPWQEQSRPLVNPPVRHPGSSSPPRLLFARVPATGVKKSHRYRARQCGPEGDSSLPEVYRAAIRKLPSSGSSEKSPRLQTDLRFQSSQMALQEASEAYLVGLVLEDQPVRHPRQESDHRRLATSSWPDAFCGERA
ncbi:hypothetical protein DPEC_G00379650 [Dallia pectoralis]|nr:hypothetical protein DPEC_G00379650 [Dallia pectoralis]